MGTTQWLRIKSLAGEPCKIRPSIQGEIRIDKNGQITQMNVNKDEMLEIELKKGEGRSFMPGIKLMI